MNNNNYNNIHRYDFNIVEFKVVCKVEWGQTVGVMGNIASLGNWEDQGIFPLTWTENHVWKGEMLIMPGCEQNFECKFVIFHKDDKNNTNTLIEMEKGANRQYNLNNPAQFITEQQQESQQSTQDNKFIISEIFNMRKVTFSVYSTPNSIIHISGNIPQFKVPQQLCYEQQIPSMNCDQQLSLYYQDFYVDMREDMMRYYYIKNFVQVERGIGRYIIFNNHITKPFAIQYSLAIPEVFKEELSFDNITENLSIGSFINSANDISSLHKLGVTAIVNLQTKRDMERKYVNAQEIRKICKSKGILFINTPIRDNDPVDYVQRAPEVLDIIEDLYKANHHIYIHCTAGIGRAPQTAILHLVLHRNYKINEASELIFSKRPVSSPNKEAIISVLKMLSESSSESTSDRSIDEEEEDYRSEEFCSSNQISAKIM
ncbi:dual specificity phosphatase domain protein (macronuclear) [Tetrahymena thermophila SB210]|uniref:Dual specificity phosphatase domain protein n=1 Tax=Tetrahymena thermophila (strain SB210) TaxID=312017 RepID=I7MMV1_TETTS|nr:dual specificity phosphatase domain protein [Tetrahymena thermophila SB210]EAS07016.1 dual specificity phosphatase domain protein [Tetrahymena thermophila SB210]|eukprot:XP_001027258.1 dual specificity phosphatase domain protein [Tetrahymena thermophila SB210]